MTEKECYAILEIDEQSTLDVIKKAYRRLAFALHPDLNPGLTGAARRFQLLNEAYVTLSQLKLEQEKQRGTSSAGKDGEASEHAKKEAQKAYEKAQAQQANGSATSEKKQSSDERPEKSDVLKDILQDPFARRVFEDIYSHINDDKAKAKKKKIYVKPETVTPDSRPAKGAARQPKAPAGAVAPAVVNKVKSWFRKQIDDEQVLRLPGAQIVGGARVRLQIQHGLSGEAQTIEVTLPPEFAAGKVMRLKGMGKRLGSWSGDLYVRIEAL